MRTHAWFAVVALAFALLAVSALPAAQASTQQPTWSPGDYWVYTVSGFGGETSTLPPLGNGTVRYDVVGTDSIPVGGSTISAYHTTVTYTVHFTYGSFSTNITLNGNEWFRTSDLAPAKVGFTATVYTSTIAFNASFNPPPQIVWPLVSGGTWGVTTTVTFAFSYLGTTNSTSAPESFTALVGDDQSITVAAGTFTATPLNESAGLAGYTVAYWSATAGNVVAQRSYTSNGNQTGKMELQSYKYQGGGFLNTLVLGIPLLYWLILLAVVVVVIAVVVLRRRRQRRVPMPPPQPPMAPPGPP